MNEDERRIRKWEAYLEEEKVRTSCQMSRCEIDLILVFRTISKIIGKFEIIGASRKRVMD